MLRQLKQLEQVSSAITTFYIGIPEEILWLPCRPGIIATISDDYHCFWIVPFADFNMLLHIIMIKCVCYIKRFVSQKVLEWPFHFDFVAFLLWKLNEILTFINSNNIMQ